MRRAKRERRGSSFLSRMFKPKRKAGPPPTPTRTTANEPTLKKRRTTSRTTASVNRGKPKSVIPANPWAACKTTSSTPSRTRPLSLKEREERAKSLRSEADAYKAQVRTRSRRNARNSSLGGVRMKSTQSNGEGVIIADLHATAKEAIAAGLTWDQAFMPRTWQDMVWTNEENSTASEVLGMLRELRRQLDMPPYDCGQTRPIVVPKTISGRKCHAC